MPNHFWLSSELGKIRNLSDAYILRDDKSKWQNGISFGHDLDLDRSENREVVSHILQILGPLITVAWYSGTNQEHINQLKSLPNLLKFVLH